MTGQELLQKAPGMAFGMAAEDGWRTGGQDAAGGDVQLRLEQQLELFLLEGGAAPYRWVNALGTFERDVTDGADFWLTSSAAPPL